MQAKLLSAGPKKMMVTVKIDHPVTRKPWWYGIGFSKFAVMVTSTTISQNNCCLFSPSSPPPKKAAWLFRKR